MFLPSADADVGPAARVRQAGEADLVTRERVSVENIDHGRENLLEPTSLIDAFPRSTRGLARLNEAKEFVLLNGLKRGEAVVEHDRCARIERRQPALVQFRAGGQFGIAPAFAGAFGETAVECPGQIDGRIPPVLWDQPCRNRRQERQVPHIQDRSVGSLRRGNEPFLENGRGYIRHSIASDEADDGAPRIGVVELATHAADSLPPVTSISAPVMKLPSDEASRT